MSEQRSNLALYGGRWVALTEEGSVAAAGATAEAARRSGALAHPQARLSLVWVSPHPPHVALPAWPLRPVRSALPGDARTWLAGGAVRDLLLHCRPYDWDFVTTHSGLALARRAANALGGAYYPLDEARGTGRAVVEDADTGEPITLDFARLRAPTLEADLQERDFTINAIALTLDGELIDPTGGREDLAAGRLRMTHVGAFHDDPARLVRAVRLAVQFALTIDEQTRAHLRDEAHLIADVAPERVRVELIKLFAHHRAAQGLRQLAELDLLSHIAPEVAALGETRIASGPARGTNALAHTVAVVDAYHRLTAALVDTPSPDDQPDAPPWLWSTLVHHLATVQRELHAYLATLINADLTRGDLTVWGALFWDVGHDTPDTDASQMAEERLVALRFSRDAVAFVTRLLGASDGLAALVGGRPDDRAIYRYFHRTRDAGVAIALLTLARLLAATHFAPDHDLWLAHVTVAQALLEGVFHRRAEVVAPPPLLTGRDVMRLGVPQGPEVGRVLEALQEAQAAGEVDSVDAARAFVRRMSEAR